MIDSCQHCGACEHGLKQYCAEGSTYVYNSNDRIDHIPTFCGIAEAPKMLDFCSKHGITSDIEVIKIEEVNAVYEHMLKSDVKYCVVIDMGSLKTA